MCDKVKYETRKLANDAIRGINGDRTHVFGNFNQVIPDGKLPSSYRKHRSKKSSMTSYYCEDCKAWHLTTQGKKTKLLIGPKAKTEQIVTIKKKKKKKDDKLLIMTPGAFKIK